ncbi:hypothetical protein [Streptomyces sp. G-G2]|uniref:hypothetical protein n=1 Tax=Streptomyces sp. G-G2 TaxID=3046201 RepID=UPI0024BB6806|nr:hypothetical protein [Streptomyces sp. G-G2]MDJ0383071.1 hypothetical protein [Streptomyces sp. G-G2]
MNARAVSVAGRVIAAGLLCAALAACGAARSGPGGHTSSAPPSCGPGTATDDDGTAPPDPPTDQEGGDPGPPTDEEPATDTETGGADPPTDQDTGAPADTTDESADDRAPGSPGSSAPCAVAAGWFDMTREFNAYYARHRTRADTFLPAAPAGEARLRRSSGAEEAVVTFTTESVGKGVGEDARRVAEVFSAWRREEYGDHGAVEIRTGRGSVVATSSW